MEVSVKKPGTPTELVHAGVKGMHWGVRKSQAQMRREADIKIRTSGAAGRAINKRVDAKFNREHITSKSKAGAIRQARAKSNLAREKWKTEQDPVKREKLKKAYLKDPNRAIALRTTRGEKVALAVMAGALAPGSFGTSLVTFGSAAAIRRANRRSIERKQAVGAFN